METINLLGNVGSFGEVITIWPHDLTPQTSSGHSPSYSKVFVPLSVSLEVRLVGGGKLAVLATLSEENMSAT